MVSKTVPSQLYVLKDRLLWSCIKSQEKSDFDLAVTAAKERLIVGDSEQSVLARLQSEGWNVKQSKFILGHAKS